MDAFDEQETKIVRTENWYASMFAMLVYWKVTGVTKNHSTITDSTSIMEHLLKKGGAGLTSFCYPPKVFAGSSKGPNCPPKNTSLAKFPHGNLSQVFLVGPPESNIAPEIMVSQKVCHLSTINFQGLC